MDSARVAPVFAILRAPYTPCMNNFLRPSEQQTLLAWSDRFFGHDTGDHVENPARAHAIKERLVRAGLLADFPDMYVQSISTPVLERVHDPRYVEAVEQFASEGGGWIDVNTVVLADSLDVAKYSAGAAAAVGRAIGAGEVQRGVALGRPPGHHATRSGGMGFCIYNNIAVATELLRDAGIERVAIIDWDVHHGNGTQDIFYERDDVFFVSIHQVPLYPGSGAANERGLGDGEGYTLNLPLQAGAGDDIYLRLFDETVTPAVRRYQPGAIMISAGFDAHRRDPLGGMRIGDLGFAMLTERAIALAEDVAGGRIGAVLEGGYDVDALARSVEAMIRVFDGATAEEAVAALDPSEHGEWRKGRVSDE